MNGKRTTHDDGPPEHPAESPDGTRTQTGAAPTESPGSGAGTATGRGPSIYRIRFAALLTKLEADVELGG